MIRRQRLKFTGNEGQAAQNPHPDAPKDPEPYVPSGELVEAVNLAILLQRPLLLEGEAGCGKTRLARAVAYELGLPFYTWNVRSTSKAEEGLYRYDALLRLHDVHLQQQGVSPVAQGRDPGVPEDYREFGPIGRAFRQTEKPAVVLIDEIDKADIDFPNDLLAVLDDPWEFEIRETGETGAKAIRADKERLPIVIITSNKEKGNLPSPFLRRCLYYYVPFPATRERLEEIVEAHYRAQRKPAKALVDAAADRFLALRKAENLHKNPGTSEFLDWLEALNAFDAKPYPASKLKSAHPLPHPELLFKLRVDFLEATRAR